MKNETNVYQKKAKDSGCRGKWAQQLTSMPIFLPNFPLSSFFLNARRTTVRSREDIADTVNERIINTKVLVAQSCPALCSPMDCSPPGSSVHGVLQARILEWVTIPFSRGSS